MRRATWFSLLALCALVCACSDPQSKSHDGGSADAASQAKDASKSDEDAGSDAGDIYGPGPEPDAKWLPVASGTCPGFKVGDGCEKDATSLICTFQPKKVSKPRKVRVWFNASTKKKNGALVVFWHGLTRMANDAVITGAGLGPKVVKEITDDDGIVISPENEDGLMTSLTQLPWYLAAGASDPQDDMLVMDDAVACALDKLGANHRRIHVTGMSAGGLQTGQCLLRRSGYLASAVVFSGGIFGTPPNQDPKNKLPIAVFYGGPNDIVSVHFEDLAMSMRMTFKQAGQFSILCNHNMGHMVPADAAQAGWDFMKDHPYGRTPEPYAKALPKYLPAYCKL